MTSDALRIILRYRTCEFSTLAKDGTPITWPVCARLLPDGRFLLTTMIGFPQKVFNLRRDPKVSLLFSEPKGSGVSQPGAVLIQGDATSEDRIVADPLSPPELADYFVENIFARQPAGKTMSSWMGRLMMPAYYMRLLIYVTPTSVRWWPDRQFGTAPKDVSLQEVRRVA